MKTHLYIEGGDSKEDQIRCREGFRKLLEKMGLSGRMPRLSACGGREAVFDDFKIAHSRQRAEDFVAMLVDSEDPAADIEETWGHLKARDRWDKVLATLDPAVLKQHLPSFVRVERILKEKL